MTENSGVEKKKSTVLSIIFLLWFAGSLLGLVASSSFDGAMWITVLLIGQYFLVFGIIAFFSSLLEKKSGKGLGSSFLLAVGLIFVGICIIVMTLFYHFSDNDLQSVIVDKVLPVSITFLFAFVGFLGVILTAVKSKKDKCLYSKGAIGKCIDVKTSYTHDDNGSTKVFSPVYEVYVDGNVVNLFNNEYTNFGIPSVGESRNIFVDEDLTGYIDPIIYRKSKIFKYLLFLAFFVMGSIAFYFALNL